MKIYYWSPFFTNIATIMAVINSANSLKIFSKNDHYNVSMIDSIGEWDYYKNKIDKRIDILNLSKLKLIKYLPKNTYLKSRISYLIIFFFSFFKLLNLINKEKPDYLIVHLITSLPIFLSLFFNKKTKIILRISGYPKINLFRKFFWKIFSNKISAVTCPTEITRKFLINENIFNKEILYTLRDPIIDMREYLLKKKEKLNYKNLEKEDYIIGIGRLTKQKNFSLLINSFKEIQNSHKNLKLIILGEGEEENKLKKIVNKLNISDKVLFLGYQKNVYKFLINAKCFILSSLWEDPGFVLIESIISNTSILSSDCPNGPREILLKNEYLFQNNNLDDLNKKLLNILNLNEKQKKNNKIFLKRRIREYTKFKHYNNLIQLLK